MQNWMHVGQGFGLVGVSITIVVLAGRYQLQKIVPTNIEQI